MWSQQGDTAALNQTVQSGNKGPLPPVSGVSEKGSGYGDWFDGYQFVYLDVGTNVGIQIRKLFEAELNPNAKVHRVFNAYFDQYAIHHGRVCAVGFEPNPKHTARLQALEEAYRAKQWRIKIFTETAASAKDGEAEFYFDLAAPPERNESGASLVPWQKIMKQGNTSVRTTVRTIDIAKYILRHVAPRRIDREARNGIIMKMDIEGAEHTVLSHMIVTGALCQADKAYIEKHPFGVIALSRHVNDTVFTQFFEHFTSKYDCEACPVQLSQLDDESYGTSDFPLPS